MTMTPMWRKCPKYHNQYCFNPDVGKFGCPYCHAIGSPLNNLIDKIANKKKKGNFKEMQKNIKRSLLSDL